MKRATAILILLLLPCALSAQYSSVNSHVVLNGNGYITVPYTYDLNQALLNHEAMSIDAWINPSTLGSVMTIVGNDLQSGYWFGLSSTGKLRFSPYPGGQYESKNPVSSGVWTHVAAYIDLNHSTVRFYINGVLDHAASVTQGWIGFNYNDLRIGADRNASGPTSSWRGGLDEVRIWNEAIDFSSAAGDLYRIPHAVGGGMYGAALVSAWRMNGNASDAVGAHNGTHAGTVSYAATPDANFYSRIGIRLQNASVGANFVDYLQIPFAKGLEMRSDYTVEFWVKPSSSGGHAQFQTLFCKYVPSPTAALYPVWLGINKSNGRLRFVPNGDMQGYFESSASLPLGKWSQVAARFGGSGGSYTATLFIDGLPSGDKKYTSVGPSNSALILLGVSTSGLTTTTYGFSGLMDELRIWNEVRSNYEIADNHRREFSGPLSNLEAVYRLDGDVLDASGNGHHGVNTYQAAQFYFYRTEDLPSLAALTLLEPNDGADWTIGDPVTVKWSSQGLHYVTVELSRNGGSTWTETLLNAGNASASSVNWTVTGPESGDVHVRVRTPSETGLEDRATKITIREPTPTMQVQPLDIPIVVSRNAPLPMPVPVIIANIGGGMLEWDVHTGGAPWLAVDPVQGTANLDTFTVALTTTDLQEGQYTEYLTIGGNATNHGLQIPVRLTVTAQRVYAVSGTVRDVTGAPVEAVPVQATGERDVSTTTARDGKYVLDFLPSGNYTVAPDSRYFVSTPPERNYTPLNNFEPGADFTVSPRRGQLLLRYHEGWNLCSIPLLPDEQDLQTLLPDAVPPAYAWDPDSGYVRRWSVEGIRAYWIKFDHRDSVTITGIFVRDIVVPFTAQQTGWNLFCGPSGACAVADIVEAPSGVLLSSYAYDPYYGYIPPLDGMIEAGRGYFVKIASPGSLYLRGEEEVSTSPVRSMLRYPGVGTLPDR